MTSYLLIGIGIFNLVLTLTVIFRKGFAEKYVATNPKAYIWRKLFGEVKAVKIIKYFFAPVGFVLGLGLVILGVTI